MVVAVAKELEVAVTEVTAMVAVAMVGVESEAAVTGLPMAEEVSLDHQPGLTAEATAAGVMAAAAVLALAEVVLVEAVMAAG